MAYREIFGRGEAKVTLRQLARRCGALSAEQDNLIRNLPLERLEASAEALLDFQGLAGRQRLTPPPLEWGHAESLGTRGLTSRPSQGCTGPAPLRELQQQRLGRAWCRAADASRQDTAFCRIVDSVSDGCRGCQ